MKSYAVTTQMKVSGTFLWLYYFWEWSPSAFPIRWKHNRILFNGIVCFSHPFTLHVSKRMPCFDYGEEKSNFILGKKALLHCISEEKRLYRSPPYQPSLKIPLIRWNLEAAKVTKSNYWQFCGLSEKNTPSSNNTKFKDFSPLHSLVWLHLPRTKQKLCAISPIP